MVDFYHFVSDVWQLLPFCKLYLNSRLMHLLCKSHFRVDIESKYYSLTSRLLFLTTITCVGSLTPVPWCSIQLINACFVLCILWICCAISLFPLLISPLCYFLVCIPCLFLFHSGFSFVFYPASLWNKSSHVYSLFQSLKHFSISSRIKAQGCLGD